MAYIEGPVEQYLISPYRRLWKWSASRPSAAGRAAGFILFAMAVIATIPVLFLAGVIMVIGSAFS